MSRQFIHIVSLFALVLVLLFTQPYWLNSNKEFLLAALAVFFAGIPHGAMDHHTASFLQGSSFQLLRYLAFYLFAALFYLAVWFVLPGFAFVLFLALTAWHFGETDMVCFTTKKIHPFFVFLYGSCLLFWLLLKERATITYWTDLVTGDDRMSNLFMVTLSAIPHLLWFAVLALILICISEVKRIWYTLFFLAVVYLAAQTSLLVGFVVYFAGWHSMQALFHLRTTVFKKAGLTQMCLYALPAIAGTVILYVVILKYGEGGWMEKNGLPSLFILLSILTLPHMFQMHRLYSLGLSGKPTASE